MDNFLENSHKGTQTRHACVIGGGSFGTVLATLLAENNCKVRWWMRDKEIIAMVNNSRHNPRFLPQVDIPRLVEAGLDISWAMENPGVVVLAVPSGAVIAVLEAISPYLTKGHLLISTTKGIPGPDFTLPHQYLEKTLSDKGYSRNNYAILSGPNIASEIADKKIAASVIATHTPGVYGVCQSYLQLSYFRLFHSPDVFGVELGAVLKNVYAIVAGLADAYSMGCNTKSALIVRASKEITDFALKLGSSNPYTFHGMAGVGDLIVTCFSPYSRNYQAGVQLGKGVAAEKLSLHVKGVIEGIPTLRLVHSKAMELGVNMPIAQGLHAILFEGKNYVRIIRELLESMQGEDMVIGSN